MEAKELVFVVEGIHGDKFHKVDLVFLCEYLGKLKMPNCLLIGIKWDMIGSILNF